MDATAGFTRNTTSARSWPMRPRGISPSFRKSKCPAIPARRSRRIRSLPVPTAPIDTPENGGIFTAVYCAGNDATFEFIGNILTEVARCFPANTSTSAAMKWTKPTGRDAIVCQARIKNEHLKNEEELQSWFVRRMEKIVNARGKILDGLERNSRGRPGPQRHAHGLDRRRRRIRGQRPRRGYEPHQVLLSGLLPIQKSRRGNRRPSAVTCRCPRFIPSTPMPDNLAPQFQSHVLGGQANLWTEYVPNFRHVEYMMFPRLERPCRK